MVQDSSVCLPVFVRFQVIEEALYDGIYAASAAVVPANVTQISGAAVSATTAQLGVNVVNMNNNLLSVQSLQAFWYSMVSGTSDSGTTTTMVDAARTESDTARAHVHVNGIAAALARRNTGSAGARHDEATLRRVEHGMAIRVIE